MRSAIYDASGNFISSYNSNAASGISSYTIPMPFGHYWNSNYTANQFQPLSLLLLNQNNFTLGAADIQWTATNPGTITSLAMYEAGPANGIHVVQMQKNGVSFGNVTMGTGGSGAYFLKPVSFSFVAGDIIKAYCSNSVAGNTQVQLSVTIQFGS